MIKYKIFTKDNYFFIIDVETSREYSSHKADVLISKRYKDFDFYTAHNIPDWNILEALKIGELIKENDSPYTESEFETFYQQFTGESSGGSGGGLATEATLLTLTKPSDQQHTIVDGIQYFSSALNSTTTQLASGASYTGTIEDSKIYPSISFLAFSDQDLTITISQFIDVAGLKNVDERVVSYKANERFSLSYPINGNYLRVSARNEGGSTTTTLQIDTAFGVIDATDEIQDDYLIGQASQTAIVNNILTPVAGANSLDISKHRAFSTQIISTATAGTFIFEGSNDNVNFQPIPVYNQALVIRVPIVTAITASASQIIYEGSCNFKYLRLRIVSTLTGGSVRTSSIFLHTPLSTTSQIISNGTAANLLTTVSGTVTANIGAGTNAIGDVGMQYRANATGAASRFHLISAATTNLTNIKNAAGRLVGYSISNTNAAWRYIKLHNLATAPTAGASVFMTIGVPPNGTRELAIDAGVAFTTGIAISTVTGAADTDTTAVGANDLIIDIFFA